MPEVYDAVETLTVADKIEVAEGVVTLTLVHPQGLRLPDWSPGAHIDLILPNGITRQYSLCGDRFDPHSYRVGVLREHASRGGSSYIHDTLAVGDRLGIGGPRNNFPVVPSQRYLFVAGGIGITPILPMIRQAELMGVEWDLVYGGRRRSSMAFLNDLAVHGDRVHVFPEDEFGLLDLPAWLGEVRSDVRVYCCGPGPLLDAVEKVCTDWPSHALRTERFVAKDQGALARATAFEVELARTGVTLTVSTDQSVLDAVRIAGVNVLSSCGQGICGTCETTVIDGRPDHRDSLLSDDERQSGDSMFICVSRASSDRLVLDL